MDNMVLVDFHRCTYVMFVDVHGLAWICMHLGGYVLIWMDMHGYRMILIDMD